VVNTEYNWLRTDSVVALARQLAKKGDRDEATALLDERDAFVKRVGWVVWDPDIDGLRVALAAKPQGGG